jgi:hypothetical protein
MYHRILVPHGVLWDELDSLYDVLSRKFFGTRDDFEDEHLEESQDMDT